MEINKKRIILLLIAVALLFFPYQSIKGQTTTEDGKYQYVNDSNAFIKAERMVVGEGWVDFELISKRYTGDIDIAFGFNTEDGLPKAVRLYKPRNITTVKELDWDFLNVSNIQTTDDDCEIGFEYNRLKEK